MILRCTPPEDLIDFALNATRAAAAAAGVSNPLLILRKWPDPRITQARRLLVLLTRRHLWCDRHLRGEHAQAINTAIWFGSGPPLPDWRRMSSTVVGGLIGTDHAAVVATCRLLRNRRTLQQLYAAARRELARFYPDEPIYFHTPFPGAAERVLFVAGLKRSNAPTP